ncbi:MAG TPA: DNA replication/repair protein RecF [Bacteroidota bacterium]
MIIRTISLRNFRNHPETRVVFGPGLNVLLGENGQGKTNVLEAVSYLSLTKSFYAASDLNALRLGQDAFEVEGEMVADGGMPSTVRVAYRREPPEKTFTINGVRPDSLSKVIGRFPVVILSPEHGSITFGGPAERRRFMDLTLSQVSSVYLDDLMEYRRILRQRNRLLADMRFAQGGGAALLEPWTVNLAEYGGRITRRRLEFAAEFSSYVSRAYGTLVAEEEIPSLQYTAFAPLESGTPAEAIARLLLRELHARADEEQRRGASLVGPHRDELQLAVNGMSVQRFASQGQHKTLLVALKIAEFFYLRERRNEDPIMLLDDLFSELDEPRTRRILTVIGTLGQAIITTTEETPFRGQILWNHRHRKFTIDHGTVRPTAPAGTSGAGGSGAGTPDQIPGDRQDA